MKKKQIPEGMFSCVSASACVLLVALVAACSEGTRSAPLPVLTVPTAPPSVPAKKLQIRGKISKVPRLAGADLIVTVGGARYLTTVAADGSYSVSLSGYQTGDFVTVRAQGIGSAKSLEWFSLVGTVGALETAAGGDGVVDGLEAGRVDVSSLDTARAGLIAQRKAKVVQAKSTVVSKADNPDALVQTDSDLQLAESELDPQEVNQVATMIQVVADNPDIAPPEGGTYGYARQTSAERAAYVADVQRDHPQEFERSSTTVATSESPPLKEADVPQQLFFVAAFTEQLPYTASTYRFNTDKRGTVRANGSNNPETEIITTWQVAENSLKVSFPATSSTTVRDLNGNGETSDDAGIAASTKRDDQFFIGTKDSTGIISVIRKRRIQISFPNKEVPDESYTLTDAGFGLNDTDQPAAARAFKGSDLIEKTLALDSSSRLDATGAALSNNALRRENATRRGDELSFRTGGVGSSLLLGNFTWSIGDGSVDARQGQLKVEYANGDVAYYEKLKPLADGVHLVRRYFNSLSGGTAYRVATAGLMFEVDATAKFDASKLPGTYDYNGVGSTQAAETYYRLFIRLDANGQGAEPVVNNYNAAGQPGGELHTEPEYGIYSYALSADGCTLVADSTIDIETEAKGCNPASSSTCRIDDHRELHVLKIVDNRIYARFYESFPAFGGGAVQSSILRFDFEAGSEGPSAAADDPLLSQADVGFKSTDDIAAVLVAAFEVDDADYVGSIRPNPDFDVTYPSSKQCSKSGSYRASANDATLFTKDGTLQALNCISQGGSVIASLNGAIATRCLDADQSAESCSRTERDYGSASARLTSTYADGFSEFDSVMALRVESNNPDRQTAEEVSTDRYSGYVRTRLRANGPTFAFLLEGFEAGDQGFAPKTVRYDGTFRMGSTSQNCYSGKVSFKTVSPIIESESTSGYSTTGGKITLTDVNGKNANVDYNADGTVTVTLDGLSKTYMNGFDNGFCK